MISPFYYHSRFAIPFLAVVRYKIWIHTGAVDSAEPDSDAHIYLCLYGERGDSGKRVISFMESDHKEKFQEGQVIKRTKYFRQQ